MQVRPRVATRQLAAKLASTLLAAAAATLGAHATDATAQPASSPSRSTTRDSTPPGGYFTYNQIKPLAGERIGAWKRSDVKVPLESGALPQGPRVIYTYRNGKQSATLTLSDAGAIATTTEAAQWKGPPNRRESDAGKEYVYREGSHTVREIERRDPPGRKVVLMLPNGIVVSATAQGLGVEMAALKALADGVSLAAAERLVRPAK
jgi:hypothetical protein